MSLEALILVSVLYSGAQPGGAVAFAPPEIFKALHSKFDICSNFQRIKIKFYILIIFRYLIRIFLCPPGYFSPHKIYLETGHLIENFVNDWHLITNILEVSKHGR